ncbi:MAG: hypothetical protein K2O30_03215 [Duncaniella sp.]|nr:hypothetical protein [Duncaniella sp.]MDE7145146.1 hypothetical protein [Duncaniella sp.]
MKRIIGLFTLLLVLAGCKSDSAQMGSDPAIDGAEMMIKCLTALKEDDKEKANDVIGEYMAYYEDKSDKAKGDFCLGASESYWNEMYLNPTNRWLPVLKRLQPLMEWYVRSDVPVTSLKNYEKLREWYLKYTTPEPQED